MLKYTGPERRAVPREGAITDEQAKGALERIIKEAGFTEGDAMREEIRKLILPATNPDDQKPAGKSVIIPQEKLQAKESEIIPENYKTQYEALPGEIKSRCAWEELSGRLLANEFHYLKLAKAMQNRGELVFIDKKGNPVFRDGGVEPVMTGMSYNKTREELYGKDYQEGTPHYGYEMPDSKKELRAIEQITGRPFVASNNKKEWRATHMESGKNPSFARDANFYPNYGNVRLYDDRNPAFEDPRLGVVRLLRVKKMT